MKIFAFQPYNLAILATARPWFPSVAVIKVIRGNFLTFFLNSKKFSFFFK